MPHKPKALLIVEDETLIAMDIAQAAEKQGYQPHMTSGVEVAIRLFDENSAHMVGAILDHGLGNGKKGVDVYKHIRQSGSSIPVVFYSGWPEQQILEDIKAAGLDVKDPHLHYCPKPERMECLWPFLKSSPDAARL